ncbi:MAG: hypothetical protein Kow0090_01940 [Myxococcota bacterium]
MPRPRLLFVTLLLLATSVAVPLNAKSRSLELKSYDLTSDKETKTLLLKLLARGELAIAETSQDEKLEQVALISLVKSDAETIFRLITTPEEHPKFINGVVSVNIKERKEKEIIYDYEIGAPLDNIDLTLKMRIVSPLKIESEPAGGDIKTGAWRWELTPISQNETLVSYYAYAEISEINFLMRELLKIETSLEIGVNITSAFMGLSGIKRKAEGKAPSGDYVKMNGEKKHHPDVMPLIAATGINRLADIMKLISPRSYLVLVESKDDGAIRQIHVVKPLNAPQKLFFEVLARPEEYPKYIEAVKRADILYAKNNLKKMDITLKMPLLGSVNYQADFLIKEPSFVYVKALGGDIKNGRWIWQAEPIGETKSLIAYSYYADMREMSWFFNVLFAIDPTMEHGANIGGGITTVKKICEIVYRKKQ